MKNFHHYTQMPSPSIRTAYRLQFNLNFSPACSKFHPNQREFHILMKVLSAFLFFPFLSSILKAKYITKIRVKWWNDRISFRQVYLFRTSCYMFRIHEGMMSISSVTMEAIVRISCGRFSQISSTFETAFLENTHPLHFQRDVAYFAVFNGIPIFFFFVSGRKAIYCLFN